MAISITPDQKSLRSRISRFIRRPSRVAATRLRRPLPPIRLPSRSVPYGLPATPPESQEADDKSGPRLFSLHAAGLDDLFPLGLLRRHEGGELGLAHLEHLGSFLGESLEHRLRSLHRSDLL